MNLVLWLEFGMVAILIGACGIFLREKYKELIEGRYKRIEAEIKELKQLQEWVKHSSYQEFEDVMNKQIPGYRERGFESLDMRIIMLIKWDMKKLRITDLKDQTDFH